MSDFDQELIARIKNNANDKGLANAGATFIRESIRAKYSYNFSALGRPIIQYPQDMVALQEIIWSTRPDLIIETGVAHGGSLILSASILSLLDYCDAVAREEVINPRLAKRRVIGVDIDIREYNRIAIQAHPMAHRIDLIQGSSVSPEIVSKVGDLARGYDRILVILDSNHTHDHVLAELEAYAPLVSVGSYCVVFDTIIEDLPRGFYPDRPWDVGDNPKTAVREFLLKNSDFEVDEEIEAKLLITVAPGGYLRRR